MILIGKYRGVPVMVVETQMGSPAVQIVLNEILSDSLTSATYRAGGRTFALPSKIVIRTGTAGGINCAGRKPLGVGDLVVATHTVGASGATVQQLGPAAFWRPGAGRTFLRRWKDLGPGFTVMPDGDPRADCSPDVVEALVAAAERVAPGRCTLGGNFTKDSLYAEKSRGIFGRLCRSQCVRSTEMELSALAPVAASRGARFGTIVSIVGKGRSWIPEAKVASADDKAMRAVLEAARKLAAGLASKQK